MLHIVARGMVRGGTEGHVVQARTLSIEFWVCCAKNRGIGGAANAYQQPTGRPAFFGSLVLPRAGRGRGQAEEDGGGEGEKG